MRNLNSPLSPDIWLADLFTSKAVWAVAAWSGIQMVLSPRNWRRNSVIRSHPSRLSPGRSSLNGVHWTPFRALLICNRAPIRWLTAV